MRTTSLDSTNEDRAQRGCDVIEACMPEGTDKESALINLLIDLMHRSAIYYNAEDFDHALVHARMHFQSEAGETSNFKTSTGLLRN